MSIYQSALTQLFIAGDGTHSQVVVDLTIAPPQDALTLPLSLLHSAYVSSVVGPGTVPNFVSATVLLGILTLNFDAAFAAYNPADAYASRYTINLALLFNLL